MKFSLMRGVDEWLGAPLCALAALASKRAPSPPPDPREVRELLLVKFLGFGTILLSMPMVRALRRRYPAARVTVLTFASNREAVEMLPPVDRVLTVDDSSVRGVAVTGFRQAMRLRGEGIDVCINLEFFSYYAMLLCALMRARHALAYRGVMESRRRIFDQLVSYERGTHISEKMLNFAAALGGETGPLELERPVPGPEAEGRVAQILRGLSPCRRPLVAVYISANDKAPKRRWPEERYREVVRWLLGKKRASALLVGGPDDAAAISEFAGAFGENSGCHNLAGRLGLRELVALLKECDLFLGNDGGPFHLAAAVGTRTVGLFGPESPEVYGPPRNGLHTALYEGPACSPCLNVYTHKNSRCEDNRCMSAITPGMVIDAVDKALAAAPPRE